ncbi:MAG: helix-turn-helix transcriptional regulator, partial [Alphaproteobacteria bacterium]|nr:helix-turn-helix transcriptional regulator [Alphaproteobacteria bacterium]
MNRITSNVNFANAGNSRGSNGTRHHDIPVALGAEDEIAETFDDESVRDRLPRSAERNLSPHVAEGIRTPIRAEAPLPPKSVAILDALGVAALVCASTAQVTFATAAARILLQRGDTIRLAPQPNGGEILVTSDRQTTFRLARSITIAASGLSPTLGGVPCSCTLAVGRGDRAPLVVALAPFGAVAEAPQALIVVSDPDAEDAEFALRIQSAFGLTRAETRLAVALARGICRKEYARSIGVQPSTVKTQVTNLFIKTGTRRES